MYIAYKIEYLEVDTYLIDVKFASGIKNINFFFFLTHIQKKPAEI